MSTTKEKSFDYQAYIKKNPPDSSSLRRGFEARKKRFEAAILKSTVQIEDDILQRFRELTPPRGAGLWKIY